MSLFGGGRRDPRERTAEERRQALIERERRRTGDHSWEPPPGHPLALTGPPASGSAPSTPAEGANGAAAPRTPRPAPEDRGTPQRATPEARSAAAPRQQAPATPRQPAPAPNSAAPNAPGSARAGSTNTPSDPLDDAGWWDGEDIHTGEAPAAPQQRVAAWPPPLDAPTPRAPQPDAATQTRSAGPTPLSSAAGAPQPGSEPQAQPRLRPAAPAQPAQAAEPRLRPARPAEPTPPRKIEPEPPAQPVAPAFDLPDHRQIAVHRRRSIAGRAPRTVVSPPGDADMGGSLSPPRSRRRRIAFLIVLLLLAGIGYSQWVLWEPLKGGGAGEVVVEIPNGASASDVATQLEGAGVIDSGGVFGVRALLAGKREDLVAGTYTLKRDMSYGAALTAITGGTPATPDLVPVTIPEGLSIREIATRLKRQNLVDDYGSTAVKVLREQRAKLRSKYGMPKATKSLEGLLFPATYELPVGFTARDLVERQLTAFEQNIDNVSMTRAKKANLSVYDVLTIASMVEREARLTRERPLIAAVIYNRLKAGMPLGIDATFRYASGNWSDPIRQSELDRDGPYNTRLRTGLPPTPIGNPGLASIEASAAPSKVNYLYFVVKPGRCGEHAFAATAAKFEEDSAKYNAARDAAGGSPVTC